MIRFVPRDDVCVGGATEYTFVYKKEVKSSMDLWIPVPPCQAL